MERPMERGREALCHRAPRHESADSKEAAKLRKRSAGFCGYDWMVDSLLMDGRILASHERAKEAQP